MPPRLVLLPGLGTNAALFRLQQPEFPGLWIPEWIEPRPNERLEQYAARFAEQLATQIAPDKPLFLGGASFGGIVAQELAHHLPATACVLIASIRSPRQLPKRFRVWTPFARVIPGISSGVSGWLAYGIGRVGRWPTTVANGLSAYAGPHGAFQRWASIGVLRWRPRPSPCPIYQIHGERDTLFPSRRQTPDRLVPNAGHLLPLTHAAAVNAFLADILRRHAATQSAGPFDGSTSS